MRIDNAYLNIHIFIYKRPKDRLWELFYKIMIEQFISNIKIVILYTHVQIVYDER